MVRNTLAPREKVHEYNHNGRHYVFLLVRYPGDLKDKVIPMMYPRLQGYKKEQFVRWFKQFGDEDAAESHRFIFNVFKRRFPDLYTENNNDYFKTSNI